MNTLSDSFSRDEQLRIVALKLAIDADKQGRSTAGSLKRTADTLLDYILTGNHR